MRPCLHYLFCSLISASLMYMKSCSVIPLVLHCSCFYSCHLHMKSLFAGAQLYFCCCCSIVGGLYIVYTVYFCQVLLWKGIFPSQAWWHSCPPLGPDLGPHTCQTSALLFGSFSTSPALLFICFVDSCGVW